MLKPISRGLVAAAAAITLSTAASAEVKAISGAGATFPYPVYSKWAERLPEARPA